jgi:hypothetical protein
LQRGRSDLVLCRRRLEVEERFNISTHGTYPRLLRSHPSRFAGDWLGGSRRVFDARRLAA